MKRILITGTSGYVASHMAKHLKNQGNVVFGLDREPMIPVMGKYLEENIQADISEKERVLPFLKETKPDAIIHCAAKCLVGESVEHPELYEDFNVRRSEVFLEACLEAEIDCFNLSSTAAVYGEPQEKLIKESHPRKPINPYGDSKMRLEDKLLKLGKERGMKIGILRYFNVAGADPDAEVGEDHEIETHMIPNAIFAALGKKSSFKIFGEDYPTPDGTCVRDYIHVLDLARAHELLLHRFDKENGPLIFNLGTKDGYSVKQVLDEIDLHVKKKIKRESFARRPGDPSVLVADSTKARQELGWTPKYSDLATIAKTALRWHEKQLGLS